MSAGRFFVAPAVLANPERIILPPACAAQVRTVLRLRPGATILLLDGTGAAAVVELTAVTAAQVVGRVVARPIVSTEPHHALTLHVGLLKAAKFEWVIQKGTEIGVAAFVPLICARATDGLADLSAAKLARWRTIATEAAEQSDRGVVPAVHAPRRLAEALTNPGTLRLVAYEAAGDGALTIPAAVRVPRALAGPAALAIDLFIGPEGGFDPAEIALAQTAGCAIVALGPRILRSETAAIVAAALTLATLGDLDPIPYQKAGT